MTGNNGRGMIVQDRDRHLLREFAVMRVIDREQAKRVAGFGSTTRANCRLLAMSRAGSCGGSSWEPSAEPARRSMPCRATAPRFTASRTGAPGAGATGPLFGFLRDAPTAGERPLLHPEVRSHSAAWYPIRPLAGIPRTVRAGVGPHPRRIFRSGGLEENSGRVHRGGPRT